MTWELKGQELNRSSSEIPSALHMIHREDLIYINTCQLHNAQCCVDGPCREMEAAGMGVTLAWVGGWRLQAHG